MVAGRLQDSLRQQSRLILTHICRGLGVEMEGRAPVRACPGLASRRFLVKVGT